MADGRRLPAALLRRIRGVTNKRARFVLDTIVQKGSVSTIDLKNEGYDHPPRAARDAVELGFALKRIQARRPDGQAIAAYVFDERELNPKLTGRVVIAKKEREAIIKAKGSKCNLCGGIHNLQLDHRVPYQVAGESQRDGDDPYQVLDGACNRKKSWACEHCENWISIKNVEICGSCYWASPEHYTHVAMKQERRADLVWIGSEVNTYERIKARAILNHRSVAEEIKTIIQ